MSHKHGPCVARMHRASKMLRIYAKLYLNKRPGSPTREVLRHWTCVALQAAAQQALEELGTVQSEAQDMQACLQHSQVRPTALLQQTVDMPWLALQSCP